MEPRKSFRSTEEVARDYGVKPQSVIAAYCRKGNYFGLVPRKLPNRYLAWPLAEKEGKQ